MAWQPSPEDFAFFAMEIVRVKIPQRPGVVRKKEHAVRDRRLLFDLRLPSCWKPGLLLLFPTLKLAFRMISSGWVSWPSSVPLPLLVSFSILDRQRSISLTRVAAWRLAVRQDPQPAPPWAEGLSIF
jgi:hypothetical protein